MILKNLWFFFVFVVYFFLNIGGVAGSPRWVGSDQRSGRAGRDFSLLAEIIAKAFPKSAIVPKGKRMPDDHSIMILDEAVVLKLGNVYANEIRHEDDLLKMI